MYNIKNNTLEIISLALLLSIIIIELYKNHITIVETYDNSYKKNCFNYC